MEDNGSMCKTVKFAPDSVVVTEASASNATTPTCTATSNGKVTQIKLATAANTSAEPEELLGSVTTQNCPGTRASARVIQKMKLDLTRPMTPPPTEREHSKKEEKPNQKTPSQMRAANKTTWTNLERNCFFDALNEFGKDFEAVANCINSKLKRRNSSSDYSFKTKDQVRQHYYQTYHKIGKYVRFTDELKKPAQELYTLINYGEMRRKLQFLTEKHFMKLKKLIYQGHITVRSKGKNIRIKTPSCKALRRLNQLDDTLEDIRLPSKIEVLVSPANMEAFGRVQSLAQNPRARAIVPLHKKLVTFIKTFQYKWRSADARLAEEQLLASGNPGSIEPASEACTEPAVCFLPKPGVPIHRPLLSITAYLSSVNICLAAYEARLGVKVRSETLDSTAAASTKRSRTESGSEKRSPETKKLKAMSSPAHEKSLDDLADASSLVKLENSSGDELSEEINELLNSAIPDEFMEPLVPALQPPPPPTPTPAAAPSGPPPVPPGSVTTTVSASAATPALSTSSTTGSASAPARTKRNESFGVAGGKGAKAAAARNFKPLLSDEVIKRIRKGWTIVNAADITIGDLYVVLGQDSKLELEYYWCDPEPGMPNSSAGISTISTTSSPSVSVSVSPSVQIPVSLSAPASSSCASVSTSVPTPALSLPSATSTSSSSLPYNANDCDSVERVRAITTATVSNKLKHLLLVANLSERVRKRQCSCGHSCDRKRDLMTKAQWLSNLASSGTAAVTGAAAATTTASDGTEVIFRTPTLPVRRPIANTLDPVRQLTKLTRQKLSRQVLVQRCLLPPSSTAQPYDLLSLRNLQNGLFEPIDRVSSSSSSSSSNSSSKNGSSSGSGSGSSTDSDLSSVLFRLNSISSGRQEQSDVEDRLNGDTKTNFNYSENSSRDFSGLDMPNLDLATEPETQTASSTTLPEDMQDDATTQNFFNGSVSPMHLLRESTSNAHWLDENVNDFSLTSLLGHLDDFNATRDILDPSSSMSVISESSVDYRHKFQEISALLQQQEKD